MKKSILALAILFVFSFSAAFAQFLAIDPSERCLNARVIGLGRTFVGLANDASAIYVNPAGLARLSNWEITSLSGKFLEDYSYLSLSGYYPTPNGTFGLGFGGYSIAGAYATKVVEGSDPADPIYEIDFIQPQIQNSNYVYLLSYASMLDRFFKNLRWSDKISLGASVKLFNVGLSGDAIQNGSASGMQMDLGLLITPSEMYSIGIALQNALPGRFGGLLTYASGHKEGFPHTLKAGGAFRIMGDKNALFRSNQELMALADVDYQLLISKTLPVYHAGLEWYPIPMIAVRAGIDQAIEGDGTGLNITTVNNISSGVGIKYGGFRFDYGYHSFVSLPGVTNHFFSFSYGLVMPGVEIKDKVIVDEPVDKLVTFDEKVKVTGNVIDPAARKLAVKAIPAKFGLKGEFETLVELPTGKNSIEVAVYDGADKLLQKKTLRALRLITFPDVARDYWVAQPISLLAMQGVITGYPDGTFRPEGNITRAEMCSLLMKSQAPSTKLQTIPKFKDINPKHWAASYIAQAAEEGIVKGYPGDLFNPNGQITRAEGLAMVARFAGVSEEAYAGEFSDVPETHWVSKIVAGAQKAGLLKYLEGKRFDANKLLTRAETVEMLQRTRFVKDLLAKDLLNWESY